MAASYSKRKHRKRDLLLWLYDWRCFWCGVHMVEDTVDIRRNESMSVSIDELKPRSRGGFQVLPNQVPAHKICNMRRGDLIAPRSAFNRHHSVLKAAGIEVEEP